MKIWMRFFISRIGTKFGTYGIEVQKRKFSLDPAMKIEGMRKDK